MKHTYIEDVGKHVGREVTLRGWVHNKRSSGKIQFIILRDGTGYIQGIVAKNAVSPEIFVAADSLTHESSVEIKGTVREDARAQGGYELDVTDLKVYQEVSKDDPFPITPKEHGIEFLMDHRHLWIRSTRQRAILKIRHEIIKAVRDFFDDKGFTLCDTPILTPAACEGTTTLFEVNYFDDTKAYLTQSGQLYNEATAAALGKVYTFGRHSAPKNRRHAAT
jgi:asparaginyl-tRNA synthetase